MSARRTWLLAGVALALVVAATRCLQRDPSKRGLTLLNVSYDPTRELYKQVNAAFSARWQAEHGEALLVRQSHGGSGKQARSVIDGLQADVVTLALAYDIDAMHTVAKLVPADWQARLPHNSCPFTSTIVFLVRAGNPKGIRDWDDLVRGDVQVVTPNPRTSGGARWNYLGAYSFALVRELGGVAALRDPAQAQRVAAAGPAALAFVGELYKRVPVLDSGARGATNTFSRGGVGDVLIAWENEAMLASQELRAEGFEIVVPSVSVLAEPPVSIVDHVIDRRGTRAAAQAYVEFLFTPEVQEIGAQQHFRPTDPEVAARHADKFPALELIAIADLGGWASVQKEHFASGGHFDQLRAAAR